MTIKKILITIICSLLLAGCTEQAIPVSTPEVSSEPEPMVSEVMEEVSKGPVVCLDAGHGFADPGCESEYLAGWEHEVNLDITLRLKEKLEAAGATVILTHDGESYPSKWIVREMANDYGIEHDSDRMVDNDIFSAYERGIYVAALHQKSPIDLFLSLHINSAENYPDTSRYEMYYFEENPYADELWDFGNAVALRLDNETRVLPTSPDDTYFVTKYVDAPAMLFEMGYATNERDAQRLNSTSWRDWLCELLTEEIMAHFTDEMA